MSDFDAKAVLENSVATVTAMLDGFTVEQRKALHDAEMARDGGPRTTLLGAIHAFDDDGSIAAAKAKAEADAAAEKARQEAESKAKADADAKAKAEADAAAEKAAPPAARLVLAKIPDPTSLKEVIAYHEAGEILLVDGDDVPLAGWPPLTFEPDAFEDVGGGVRLNRTIDMGIELPAAQVAAAWLRVGETAIAVARLPVPLPAGGGRRAQLPAGGMRFRNDG